MSDTVAVHRLKPTIISTPGSVKQSNTDTSKQHQSTPDVRHIQVGKNTSIDSSKRVLSIDVLQPEHRENDYQTRRRLRDTRNDKENVNFTDSGVVHAHSAEVISPATAPEEVEWGTVPFSADQNSSLKLPLGRTRSNENVRVGHTAENTEENIPSEHTTQRTNNEYLTRAELQPKRHSGQELLPGSWDRSSNRSSRPSSAEVSPPIVTQPMAFEPIPKSISSSRSRSAFEEVVGCSECSKCGKCRCPCCSKRRELPGNWVCGGKWYCSGESVIDLLSCMCLVKGLFYHCCDDPHDVDPDPDPCDCSGSRCNSRWATMIGLSFCLPCLLCYWPMTAGYKAVDACYNCFCCRPSRCTCDRK